MARQKMTHSATLPPIRRTVHFTDCVFGGK
jgi:hypothetical protein